MIVGDLFTALKTANSGLLAQQQAIDVVAQNISNVNSDGYTRRTVSFTSTDIAGEGRGVSLASIGRTVDDGMISSLRTELSTMNAANVYPDYDQRIQDVFGSPDANAALPQAVAQLQAAFETLAATPESTLNKSEVVSQAEGVSAKLQQTSSTIQSLRSQADQQISADVNEVSTLLGRIADLNDKIVRANEMQQSAADALDARDQALNRLSELMDVRIYTRPRGDVVVFTGSGSTLVDDQPAQLSHQPASTVTPGVTASSGGFDGITLTMGGNSVDITAEIHGGELAGLIDLRDSRLPDLQSSVDALAAGLRDQVNAVHNQGTPWPGATQLQASHAVVNPAAESLTWQGSADTALVLLDSNGNEVRHTTVRTLLGGAAGGTLDQIQQAVDGWLQPDGSATFDASGRLTISVTTAGLGLGIVDQASSADGASPQPATLTHAIDAGDAVPRTIGSVNGFSAFFGLNDVFVGGNEPTAYASQLLSSGYTTAAPADLKLVDASGQMPDASGAPADITVPAGSSLADIASLLSAVPGVQASVVTEGGGARLSVTTTDGRPFSLVDNSAAGDHLLADLGFGTAQAGTAASLTVRGDLSDDPSLLSTGQPTWQPDQGFGGSFALGIGNGDIARGLADALSNPVSVLRSGNLSTMTASLADYASAIVANQSAAASSKADEVSYETTLVESLQNKADSFSGVNLDEELANMMVYQQAYSAAARVMSTVQTMFDTLQNAVA